jgi:iron-sulfur cluster insertion protein
MSLTLTPTAAARIHALAVKDGRSDLRFRLGVAGGGCSGFQYVMELDAAQNPDDQIFTLDNAAVIVDATSLPFLEGAVLDYVESLSGAAFEIKNPNSTAKCGCGSSFAV